MVISLLDETTVSVVVVCIVICLIYAFIFMLITSNFHMTKYHKKIQDFLFYWYISEALSGRRPWIEINHLVNPEKASVWDMKKRLEKGLALKIQTESETRISAKKLFQNVAKPGSEFIEFEDLARFLPENDALATLNIFDGISKSETTQISCLALQDLMVYAFRLEKSLVLSMKDTDYIISNMRIIVYMFSGIVQAIALVVSVMLGGCGGYMVNFFIFLPCLAMALPSPPRKLKLFNESIHFLFFDLPFDVGERCVIDGDELVVQKINFFSTIFVRADDKRNIRLTNGALLRKCVSTFEGSSRLEKIKLILR